MDGKVVLLDWFVFICILFSVTLPGSETYSEIVNSTTLNTVQTVWEMDRALALKKHFPSVNWFHSYSKNMKALTPYYNQLDPQYVPLVTKAQDILQKEAKLNEAIGKVLKFF